MENHVDKKVEHEMETGVCAGLPELWPSFG